MAVVPAPLNGISVGSDRARAAGAYFPVHWERPDDGDLTWTLDRSHWPGPLAPLAFEVAGEPVARGLMAAASAYELPISEIRTRRINGYRYQSKVPLTSPPPVAESTQALTAEVAQRDGFIALEP
jgi:hypothetical protein